MELGFTLTSDALSRIGRTVRRDEDTPRFGRRDGWRPGSPGMTSHTARVRVNGALTGNFYPGVLCRTVGDGATVEELGDVWLWAMNGRPLVDGDYYEGRLTGQYGGLPVFDVHDPTGDTNTFTDLYATNFYVTNVYATYIDATTIDVDVINVGGVSLVPLRVREADGSPVTYPCSVFNVAQTTNLTWADAGSGEGTLAWSGLTCLEALTAIGTRIRLNMISGVLTTVAVSEDAGNNCITAYWDWDGVRVRRNNGGSTYTRRRIDFVEGDGIQIVLTDDATDDEVDVLIKVLAYDTISQDRKDFYYHKSVTGTTSGTRTYTAGMSAGLAASGTASIDVDTIYAIPLCHPKGGTISSIALTDTSGGGGDAVVVGVYEATSDTDLYPAALVASATGTLAAGSTPTVINLTAVLDGTKLYYIAVVADTNVPLVAGLGANGIYPVLGSASLGAAQGICWKVDHTYDGTLPDPFPGSGTIGTGTANSIALGVTFSA